MLLGRFLDTDPANWDDGRLYKAACSGNERAFSVLYGKFSPLVYRLSLQWSQDETIAEEVTQEVFLSLIQTPNRYDASRGSLSSWLCGVARNQVLKQFERRRRLVSLGDEESETSWEPVAPATAAADPHVALTQQEAVEAVREALRCLPLHLREVVVLCELEEQKYEEAARILEVPVGTVRSRLHRAKEQLARRLASVQEGVR